MFSFSVSHGCGSTWINSQNSQISLIVWGTNRVQNTILKNLFFGSIAMMWGWFLLPRLIPSFASFPYIPIIQSYFCWPKPELLMVNKRGIEDFMNNFEQGVQAVKHEAGSLKNREVLRCAWHLLILVHVVCECAYCVSCRGGVNELLHLSCTS